MEERQPVVPLGADVDIVNPQDESPAELHGSPTDQLQDQAETFVADNPLPSEPIVAADPGDETSEPQEAEAIQATDEVVEPVPELTEKQKQKKSRYGRCPITGRSLNKDGTVRKARNDRGNKRGPRQSNDDAGATSDVPVGDPSGTTDV